MPKVPSLDRSVAESALPSLRSKVETSTETFGGGKSAEALGNATEKMVGQVQKMALEEKQRADDTVVKELYSKAVNAKNRLQYDSKNGAFTRRGKNAAGIVEEYGSLFDKEMDELEKGLVNEDQRHLFQAMRQRERMEFDTGLHRHMGNELKAYEIETNKAVGKTARDEMLLNFRDPDKVAHAESMLTAAVMDLARLDGVHGTEAGNRVKAAVSDAHKGIITRMLSQGDDLSAKRYYEDLKKKDYFTPDDLKDLDNTMKEGSTQGASQRLADELWAKHGGFAGAMKAVKNAATDPDVRDQTEARLRQRMRDADDIKKKNEEYLYKHATDLIDKARAEGKDPMSAVPPHVMASLPPEQKNGVRRYAAGEERESSLPEFQNYTLMAATPETRQKFMQTDFAKISSLSVKDQRHFMEMQAKIAKGESVDEKLGGFLTASQIVEKSMDELSMKDKEERAQVLKKASLEAEKFEKQTGRKPSQEEVQGIVDKLVMPVITDKGFFFDSTKKVYALDDNDQIQDVKFSDIPRSEKKKIQDALAKARKPFSEGAVVDLYLRKLRGSRGN